MTKKGQARDTKETANLRDYLREHHPEIFTAVRDAAVANVRTFNQQVTFALQRWLGSQPGPVVDASSIARFMATYAPTDVEAEE